jgi:hypothetical protein
MSIEELSPPPRPETVLTVIDLGARGSMKTAQEALRTIVASETPRVSGEVAAALRPRLSKTATGTALTVGAPRGKKHGHGTATIADVMRWLNRGTGIYREGPGPKRKIRAKNPLKRMTLPGGAKRRSVKGQEPNPFMHRIREQGTLRVQEAAQEGAAQVARDLERAI